MQINAINSPVEKISPVTMTPTEKPPVTAEIPKPAAAAAEQTPEQFDRQENLNKLKEVLGEHNIMLKFRQDDETKAVIVELVNEKTGEAIRQIPSEISLKLAAVYVKMQGQFIDKNE